MNTCTMWIWARLTVSPLHLHAVLALAVVVIITSPANLYSQVWQQRGPAPIAGGQVEGMEVPQIVGAINAIAVHPTDPDVVFVGAANGGIWRTGNLNATSPQWTNTTENERSLSIGALEFDPTDQSNQTLLAGIGRTSSLAGIGSTLTGLLRSNDFGESWIQIRGGSDELLGLNISGVASRGSTIVVAVDSVDDSGVAASPGGEEKQPGIWRSTDSGSKFARVTVDSGLPAGRSFDLVGTIEDPAVLYTNAGSSGLFKSEDTGATWQKVSDDTMDVEIAAMVNCEIAVGTEDHVYVAIVRNKEHPSGNQDLSGARLSAVFRSDNGGESWTNLGTPATVEAGDKAFGLHPGGQGDIHLAIAVDPTDNNIVYLGGDRQPDLQEGIQNAQQIFPNSIGARDYSARAFRGDASSTTNRWVHLTHDQSDNGGGTANGSSPHADLREMVFSANGNLLLGCDGGIYQRTDPRSNEGDWFSLNGDMSNTEFHAVSWDSVSDVIIGGAQDNGSADSRSQGNVWEATGGGDGGVTLVDDFASTTVSIRYTSAQNLSGLMRRRFNSAGQRIGPPRRVGKRIVNANGQPLFFQNGEPAFIIGQFYTPLAINPVNPDRILFGGATIYESFDQGDTAQLLTGPGNLPIRVNSQLGLDCLSYGAENNEDAFYAGSRNRIFIRTAAPPAAIERSTAYQGGNVQALVMDPGDFEIAFVADEDQVFRTENAGDQWADISNNLNELALGELISIAYRPESDQIIVGGHTGVAIASGPAFESWSTLGTGFPNAPVYHLEYDAADDLLLAGTLGRGAWTLQFE